MFQKVQWLKLFKIKYLRSPNDTDIARSHAIRTAGLLLAQPKSSIPLLKYYNGSARHGDRRSREASAGLSRAADQRLGADESPAEQSIRQTNALVQTALW